MQLGDQGDAGAARGARGQPGRLDEQDPAQPGPPAEHRRGQTDHPAADHQDIRAAVQVGGHTRIKQRVVATLERVGPQRRLPHLPLPYHVRRQPHHTTEG